MVDDSTGSWNIGVVPPLHLLAPLPGRKEEGLSKCSLVGCQVGVTWETLRKDGVKRTNIEASGVSLFFFSP